MMNIGKLTILSFALLCVCTGCSTVSTSSAATENSAGNLVLGDQMIAAMKNQDYACFVKDFSKELKESVTSPAFHKLCSDLENKKEKIETWKLLDTLDRGGLYHTEIWKVAFLRDGRQGKVRVERLFYVSTAKLDNRIVVIGFRGDPLF